MWSATTLPHTLRPPASVWSIQGRMDPWFHVSCFHFLFLTDRSGTCVVFFYCGPFFTCAFRFCIPWLLQVIFEWSLTSYQVKAVWPFSTDVWYKQSVFAFLRCSCIKHGRTLWVGKLHQCRSVLNVHSIWTSPDGNSCDCKKTSGPIDVYGKTAFCRDFHSHFSAKLVGLSTVTLFSYCYRFLPVYIIPCFMHHMHAMKPQRHRLMSCQSQVVRR